MRCFILPALALSCSLAMVHAGDEAGNGADGQKPNPHLRERADANHDGQVSPEERQQARADFLKDHPKLLEKFDTNHDGKLDESERKAAHAAFEEKIKREHPKAFEKADANHDGHLDRKEMETLREMRREHQGNGDHKPQNPGKLKGGDE